MTSHPELESLKRLEIAVSRLPRATREIFLAHCVDEMSYQEIADCRGLSVREVERHVARAICRLSKDIDEKPLRWWERLLRY